MDHESQSLEPPKMETMGENLEGSSMNNGINSGSTNGTNKELEKEKRIRLTLKDIQIINEALHVYDRLPDPHDGSKKYSWSETHVLLRRFSNLAENDGFYSRRHR